MRALALPLLLLLAAQKPGADDALDPARETWRGQGIALCVAELRALEGMSPDDLEAVCGCAFERLMAGRETADLPRFTTVPIAPRMAGPLVACAGERGPTVAAAVGRHLASASVAAAAEPPAAAPAAPDDKPPPDAAPAADRPAFDAGAWLSRLALPAAVPRWAWIPLVVLALALLRLLFFRRLDGGRDLDGPPPRMRPRAGPSPPRR